MARACASMQSALCLFLPLPLCLFLSPCRHTAFACPMHLGGYLAWSACPATWGATRGLAKLRPLPPCSTQQEAAAQARPARAGTTARQHVSSEQTYTAVPQWMMSGSIQRSEATTLAWNPPLSEPVLQAKHAADSFEPSANEMPQVRMSAEQPHFRQRASSASHYLGSSSGLQRRRGGPPLFSRGSSQSRPSSPAQNFVSFDPPPSSSSPASNGTPPVSASEPQLLLLPDPHHSPTPLKTAIRSWRTSKPALEGSHAALTHVRKQSSIACPQSQAVFPPKQQHSLQQQIEPLDHDSPLFSSTHNTSASPDPLLSSPPGSNVTHPIPASQRQPPPPGPSPPPTTSLLTPKTPRWKTQSTKASPAAKGPLEKAALNSAQSRQPPEQDSQSSPTTEARVSKQSSDGSSTQPLPIDSPPSPTLSKADFFKSKLAASEVPAAKYSPPPAAPSASHPSQATASPPSPAPAPLQTPTDPVKRKPGRPASKLNERPLWRKVTPNASGEPMATPFLAGGMGY